MNWRKSIYIKDILKEDISVHKKADLILMALVEAVKESEMDDDYDAVAHDFALVRKTEELDHALENLYKWAEDNLYWLG